jgi:hypothetical protein
MPPVAAAVAVRAAVWAGLAVAWVVGQAAVWAGLAAAWVDRAVVWEDRAAAWNSVEAVAVRAADPPVDAEASLRRGWP